MNIIFYILKPFTEEEISEKKEILNIFFNIFRFSDDEKELFKIYIP